MMLGVLLAVPLIGAVLLWRAAGRVATALHTLTAGFTLAAALAVGVRVNQGPPLVALDGFLRADALSGWMIAWCQVSTENVAVGHPANHRKTSTNFAKLSLTSLGDPA